MYLCDVGDGMDIVTVASRPPWAVSLDLRTFSDGLSAYRLFDEDNGEWIIPVRLSGKLPGWQDALLSCLRPYLSQLLIDQFNGRLVMRGLQCRGPVDLDFSWDRAVDNVLSFLFGMVWSHGFYERHPRYWFVRRLQIQWVCSPTVAGVEGLLKRAVAFLQERGMMIMYTELAWSSSNSWWTMQGSSLQIIITDPEIVWSFGCVFALHGEAIYDSWGDLIEHWTLEEYFVVQWSVLGWNVGDLLDWFLAEELGWPEIIAQIPHSVLKKRSR
jgi:hypothetical protein